MGGNESPGAWSDVSRAAPQVGGPALIASALRCDAVTSALAIATCVGHLLTARGYGIFRDELYYLACGRNLDFGYVDHPPLIALVARLVEQVLGSSLVALRLVPALTAGLTVVLAASIARQLGGARFAQRLAGLVVALAPVYLSLQSILSMNALDLVFWSLLLLLFVMVLGSADGRLWLPFGVVAGLGLQNKLSVLFLGVGVAIGLVAGRQWSHLRDRRLWLGGALAALLFAPHVIWQSLHGWPTAEFVRNATESKNLALAPASFLLEQLLLTGPIAAVLWVVGLGWLFLAQDSKPHRSVGFAYLAVLLVMLTQNAKPYYLSPFYPVLIAAGAVALERASSSRGWGWLRAALAGLALACGLLLAPLAKPLLPVERFVRYAAALGFAPGSDERHTMGRLPQFFADMHGWKELAEAVAQVHRALPADEQTRACVFAGNYGEAGAIDHFRSALGLPIAISGHNSYWLWGTRGCDGAVMIVIGGDREGVERYYRDVHEAGRFTCQDCMPYENDQPLWVARDPRGPLEQAWPAVKHFN